MTTIADFESIEGRLRSLWNVNAIALAAGNATPEGQCAWIDRATGDAESLMVWIEHRERILAEEPESDPDEVWAVLKISPEQVQMTSTYQRVLESGFERTLANTPAKERVRVQHEMAAIVWDANAIEGLAATILAGRRLPRAWLEATEGAESIKPRVFVLKTGERIRVQHVCTPDRNAPSVEMHLSGDRLLVYLTGFKRFAGHHVDAALGRLDSDAVFTAFPLPEDRNHQPAVARSAWKEWRTQADAHECDGTKVVQRNGECGLEVPIPENARPIADKVLVIVLGNRVDD